MGGRSTDSPRLLLPENWQSWGDSAPLWGDMSQDVTSAVTQGELVLSTYMWFHWPEISLLLGRESTAPLGGSIQILLPTQIFIPAPKADHMCWWCHVITRRAKGKLPHPEWGQGCRNGGWASQGGRMSLLLINRHPHTKLAKRQCDTACSLHKTRSKLFC